MRNSNNNKCLNQIKFYNEKYIFSCKKKVESFFFSINLLNVQAETLEASNCFWGSRTSSLCQKLCDEYDLDVHPPLQEAW